MGFTRISNSQINSRGATTLPNQPQISAIALKEEFDAPAKQIVAPAVNNLMDELEASTSANSLGAVAPTGRTGTTVQGVINSVSTDLATLETNAGQAIADAHTHANKAVIDKFNDTGTGLTYDGNPVGAVTSVNSKTGAVTLNASDVGALPSSTTIPTKTSDLTNDSGFITSSAVPTKTSDLTNDSNFATTSDVNTAVATKSKVTWSQQQGSTGAVKIAEINIDGTSQDVYAPNGGGSADAYKTIEAGSSSFVASGADTFKINAGSNVTITPLASPDKGIQISASGGGTSTGDMLMADYDSAGTVKNTTGGIVGYVAGEIGKLDVSDSAVSGQYVSAVSEADGKISVSRASLPTVPTKVSDLTNDSGYQTASDVSTAISGKEDKSALKDLAYIAKDGVGSTKVLQGDGTWVTPSSGGHNMLDNSTIITGINASISEGTSNDDVVSAYGVGVWANTDTIKLLTTVAQGDDSVGTWEDDATWESGSRAYWLKHESLHGILSDDDVEISLVFDVSGGEAISCLAYRIDDAITSSLGGIAIKFNAPIQSSGGATVGVVLKHNRTKTSTITRTS